MLANYFHLHEQAIKKGWRYERCARSENTSFMNILNLYFSELILRSILSNEIKGFHDEFCVSTDKKIINYKLFYEDLIIINNQNHKMTCNTGNFLIGFT